jgi:hypothetical protein
MAGAVLVSTFSLQPWADACNSRDWKEVGAPPHWQPIPLRSIDCQCGGSMCCADFYRQIFTPPDNQVHPTQVTHWKSQMLAGAAEVFDQGRGRKVQEEAVEQDKERLERKIGQLVVEVDWLSKKCKELGIDP